MCKVSKTPSLALANFRKGDPCTKVEEGYARLPGAGYEALHPELEGVNPEDYPDIAKMRILGDVAPYSREYQRYAGIVSHSAEYERIQEQVRQTKESTIQVSQRHFNAPVDTIEGTVKSASAQGVELKEYPGRTFRFSSVGSTMADLTADMLGKSNSMTRAQAVKEADSKLSQRDAYLADVLADGTHVKAVVPRGAAESAQDIRAVISADGTNINQVPSWRRIQNSPRAGGKSDLAVAGHPHDVKTPAHPLDRRRKSGCTWRDPCRARNPGHGMEFQQGVFPCFLRVPFRGRFPGRNWPCKWSRRRSKTSVQQI
jgi:hypothetical protein